jgi:hypothetical protein
MSIPFKSAVGLLRHPISAKTIPVIYYILDLDNGARSIRAVPSSSAQRVSIQSLTQFCNWLAASSGVDLAIKRTRKSEPLFAFTGGSLQHV